MTCLICEKELYSGIGKGCKMCGMPLEKKGNFCCGKCKNEYFEINSGGLKNE